jgi:hypothetical protein
MQNAILRIVDLTGKEVIRQELEQGQIMAKIDVNRLNNGIYFVMIRDGNHMTNCMIHISE